MLDENLDLNQDQDAGNPQKKLEMDCEFALRIYRVLKIVKDELNSAEVFAAEGNAAREWNYSTIERKDVWVEKTNNSYKVVHQFSYKSKYEMYFIVYGCGKGVSPYVEINKDNDVLFKAEVEIETLKFDIKISKYELKDEWYKVMFNHFYLFEAESERRE